MISIEDKILARIKRNGRSWAFTNRDFIDLASPSTLDWSLYRLKDKKEIRSLLRGIYDYPGYSKLLQEELPPDLVSVANAIARKFQWHIQISGDTALNYLGLSTQVPMRTIYYSDGPNRTYSILGRSIEFKHIRFNETKFLMPKSELVVQALLALGQEQATPDVIQKLRAFLPEKERSKVLKDTQYTIAWVYEIIKRICDHGAIDNG